MALEKVVISLLSDDDCVLCQGVTVGCGGAGVATSVGVAVATGVVVAIGVGCGGGASVGVGVGASVGCGVGTLTKEPSTSNSIPQSIAADTSFE